MPHRLNAIASLQLSWFFGWNFYGPPTRVGKHPAYDLGIWEDCCHVLASMKGLRILRITVAGVWIDNNPAAMKILDPLRAVKTPKTFEVEGPWPWDCAVDFSDAPFDLITLDQRWRETFRPQPRISIDIDQMSIGLD